VSNLDVNNIVVNTGTRGNTICFSKWIAKRYTWIVLTNQSIRYFNLCSNNHSFQIKTLAFLLLCDTSCNTWSEVFSVCDEFSKQRFKVVVLLTRTEYWETPLWNYEAPSRICLMAIDYKEIKALYGLRSLWFLKRILKGKVKLLCYIHCGLNSCNNMSHTAV
jgi:hypothetical protein